MFCPKCGKPVDHETRYCDQCGANTTPFSLNTFSNLAKEVKGYIIPTALIVSLISVLSTIYILYFRIVNQEYLGYKINSHGTGFMEVCGIAPEWKLPISFIPFTATAIAILLVILDKNLSMPKKVGLVIINLIFAILSLLIIWIDVRAH